MHLAALFDMDGLLIDSEASIMRAWLAAAAEMDIALAPIDYLSVVGRSGPDAVALLSGMFGGNKRFELARRRVLERLDQTPASQRFPLKEGADALLAHLAEQDVPCAVASSSARDEIEARLTAVGIRSLFTAIVGGDEVARGKPDPLIYLEAASRLGVDTTRCIAFEDSHNGAKVNRPGFRGGCLV